jgi:hypothetical protein
MWGGTPTQFLQACYRNGIRYIAWDSRSGLDREDPDYKPWRLDRIKMLQKTKSVGPYEFVTQIKHPNGEYINIFRLDTPAPLMPSDRDEFAALGNWYRENAHFPEKSGFAQVLITSAPELLRQACPYNDDYFWHTSSIWGESADDFLQSCWDNVILNHIVQYAVQTKYVAQAQFDTKVHFLTRVHYIAWDSYHGNDTESASYQQWRLHRIQMLSEPRSIGPYEFIQQFKGSDGHVINLFRLQIKK